MCLKNASVCLETSGLCGSIQLVPPLQELSCYLLFSFIWCTITVANSSWILFTTGRACESLCYCTAAGRCVPYSHQPTAWFNNAELWQLQYRECLVTYLGACFLRQAPALLQGNQKMYVSGSTSVSGITLLPEDVTTCNHTCVSASSALNSRFGSSLYVLLLLEGVA